MRGYKTYFFADESGNFLPYGHSNATKNFYLCTILPMDNSISSTLLDLKRTLQAEKKIEKSMLHCTDDNHEFRSLVFEIIANGLLFIDVSVLDKSRINLSIQSDPIRLYAYAWEKHLASLVSQVRQTPNKMLFTAAGLGKNRQRAAFKAAVNEAVQQTFSRAAWAAIFVDSAADPMLWLSDYCAWAIQRKYERDDTHWYDIIKPKIRVEKIVREV